MGTIVLHKNRSKGLSRGIIMEPRTRGKGGVSVKDYDLGMVRRDRLGGVQDKSFSILFFFFFWNKTNRLMKKILQLGRVQSIKFSNT